MSSFSIGPLSWLVAIRLVYIVHLPLFHEEQGFVCTLCPTSPDTNLGSRASRCSAARAWDSLPMITPRLSSSDAYTLERFNNPCGWYDCFQ